MVILKQLRNWRYEAKAAPERFRHNPDESLQIRLEIWYTFNANTVVTVLKVLDTEPSDKG